jgi:hypothetical protein
MKWNEKRYNTIINLCIFFLYPFFYLATTHSVRNFSQISDDDRMSLTTAISDEDDGESIMASPYKAKATGTAAASFNCTGAVRKAG